MGDTLEFTINEFGVVQDDVTDPSSTKYCNPVDNGIGTKYNPLTELSYYGASNPYQDPKRGAIDKVVANGCDDFIVSDSLCQSEPENTAKLEQFDLLQNLEDLVGRSVSVTDFDNATDPREPYFTACC